MIVPDEIIYAIDTLEDMSVCDSCQYFNPDDRTCTESMAEDGNCDLQMNAIGVLRGFVKELRNGRYRKID